MKLFIDDITREEYEDVEYRLELLGVKIFDIELASKNDPTSFHAEYDPEKGLRFFDPFQMVVPAEMYIYVSGYTDWA